MDSEIWNIKRTREHYLLFLPFPYVHTRVWARFFQSLRTLHSWIDANSQYIPHTAARWLIRHKHRACQTLPQSPWWQLSKLSAPKQQQQLLVSGCGSNKWMLHCNNMSCGSTLCHTASFDFGLRGPTTRVITVNFYPSSKCVYVCMYARIKEHMYLWLMVKLWWQTFFDIHTLVSCGPQWAILCCWCWISGHSTHTCRYISCFVSQPMCWWDDMSVVAWINHRLSHRDQIIDLKFRWWRPSWSHMVPHGAIWAEENQKRCSAGHHIQAWRVWGLGLSCLLSLTKTSACKHLPCETCRTHPTFVSNT